MSKNATEEYVDVLITWDTEQTETEEVLVAIGDGSVAFDEDYPFDPRVYFYFDNREQFEKAKTGIVEDINFQILEVLE